MGEKIELVDTVVKLPVLRNLDVVRADSYYYFITISPSLEYTAAQWDVILDWHRKSSTDQCLVVFESRPGDGTKHLHSCISHKANKACRLTLSLERLLEKHSIPWAKPTVDVKTCTDVKQLYTYLMKDQSGPPVLIMGWKLSWIKQTVKDNVKKMKPSELTKGRRMLTAGNSVAFIQAYASANGHRLDSKDSIVDCLGDMAFEKFDFQKIKFKGLYVQLMSESGVRRSFRDYVMLEISELS